MSSKLSLKQTTTSTPLDMLAHNDEDLSFDEFDEINSPRPNNTDLDTILQQAITRRGFIGGVVGFGLSQFLLSNSSTSQAAGTQQSIFDFEPIKTNSLDTVTIPKGFSWQVVVQWGDPLWSDGAPLDEKTGGTAHSQSRAFGDNNDGMSFIEHNGHNLLVANNEYINKRTLLPLPKKHRPQTTDDVLKSKAGHGISVVEIINNGGKWDIVKDSPLNRRITADTPIEITGPAAGDPLLQTKADPAGVEALGTFNNCGNGLTPWGTYLTCEENFNGYFSSSDKNRKTTKEEKRYGLRQKDYGYNWAIADERFDMAKHPNEPNRFGYVVEFDPRDPTSPIKKRTKLGRFKHENAEVVIAKDNRVVVYMGDDERGEFLYKFVSRDIYVPGKPTEKLLNKGTLYVAKFYDDQRGSWLPLTPETTSMSEAEICIHTRLAASKVGGTTMDRPEWVAAHPEKTQIYCALTNNKNRGKKPNQGGDETPVGGPNPRAQNLYGQILKLEPIGENHTDTQFEWSLFALAGNPTIHHGDMAGSENITPDNMFNSPDGLAFDTRGRLWIQTDGKTTNKDDFAGMGNNQMLVGDTNTGQIARFLVGPKECEVTGLCWSRDRKTMFVGIQHPGNKGGSHFPLGSNHSPRSSIIAVTRKDGEPIG